MPLLLKKNIAPHSILGIWQISEDEETLYRSLGSRFENDTLIQASKPRLRIQRLCARALLKEITGLIELGYNPTGKPFLPKSDQSVSISHTNDLVALIVSKAPATGIDIESISARIIPLAKKFLAKEEMEELRDSILTDQLHVYWGAKEALYKWHGKKGLIFGENIHIFPFQPGKGQGILRASIKTEETNREFELIYEKIGNHMLVYVTNS